ncbi:hypothetical protein ZWY2020_044327 [Hordeum vulgare]|nr:hypothetical protein ZWY2020_044327 [Hordeum vulgare]
MCVVAARRLPATPSNRVVSSARRFGVTRTRHTACSCLAQARQPMPSGPSHLACGLSLARLARPVWSDLYARLLGTSIHSTCPRPILHFQAPTRPICPPESFRGGRGLLTSEALLSKKKTRQRRNCSTLPESRPSPPVTTAALASQYPSLKRSLFDQASALFISALSIGVQAGIWMSNFEVEDLQDEASPNFAEEVVSLFFKDSARLVTNIEQAMEKYPKDFNRWDAHMQQLRGSCFRYHRRFKMNNECTSFRNSCRKKMLKGISLSLFLSCCRRSFQKVKREHAVLRQKLESYFQLLHRKPVLPGRPCQVWRQVSRRPWTLKKASIPVCDSCSEGRRSDRRLEACLLLSWTYVCKLMPTGYHIITVQIYR